jgi:hypothetical protein
MEYAIIRWKDEQKCELQPFNDYFVYFQLFFQYHVHLLALHVIVGGCGGYTFDEGKKLWQICDTTWQFVISIEQENLNWWH